MLFGIGLLFVIVGFGVGMLAFIIVILSSARGAARTRGGGVVMIGPVPIIFGTDKESARVLVMLAVVLMVLFLVLSLLPIIWR